MRNAGFNFLGAALPAVLAIITIPYIVTGLGTTDYGLLALITSIVGYFALLDVNITASSTKYVSQYNASGDKHRLNEAISFGLLTYTGIGLIGMAGLYLSAEFLVGNIFAIPANRSGEAVAALQIAALGFLFGQVLAYLQSLPGALMRYDISGRIEATFGTIVPLATVALLYLGFGLLELVWLRVGMSALQAMLVWGMLRKLLPMWRMTFPSKEIRNMMLSFSAYSFLSRLASLTYTNADKLIIGARVGVSALTFYVVPATLANRVTSLVYRLSGVMFPHTSALAARGRLQDLERTYLQASRYMFFINGAIALALVTLAHPILTLWIGPEFARSGTVVMMLIALAQWVDSLTNLPSLVNDGLGHPKVSGMFALSRAILGLGLIFIGVWHFGIEGAAGAHFLASIVMSIAFVLYVHGRTVPIALPTLIRQALFPPLAILVAIGITGVLLSSYASRGWLYLLATVGAMGTIFLVGGFWHVCLPSHRKQILCRIGMAR